MPPVPASGPAPALHTAHRPLVFGRGIAHELRAVQCDQQQLYEAILAEAQRSARASQGLLAGPGHDMAQRRPLQDPGLRAGSRGAWLPPVPWGAGWQQGSPLTEHAMA